MKRPSRVFILLALLGFFVLAVLLFLFVPGSAPNLRTVNYGVTFSRAYAEDGLGLDGDVVLRGALDELGVRRFRIPAYWNRLEAARGEWMFDELDGDIKEIAKREGTIVLAIGRKLPRWPECWIPEWVGNLSLEKQREATLAYIETVVRRYQDNPAIVGWQVENEAYFPFGVCPKLDTALLQQELDLVRRLDTRPISSTESGELSLWTSFGDRLDLIGVSVYRVTVNPILGTWHYFLPPHFYARKAALLKPWVKPIYVSEFQMEPWSLNGLPDTPLDVQFETMSIEQMRKNFAYAKRMGISPIDFWGVEWWYWMKEEKGHPEFWEEARGEF